MNFLQLISVRRQNHECKAYEASMKWLPFMDDHISVNARHHRMIWNHACSSLYEWQFVDVLHFWSCLGSWRKLTEKMSKSETSLGTQGIMNFLQGNLEVPTVHTVFKGLHTIIVIAELTSCNPTLHMTSPASSTSEANTLGNDHPKELLRTEDHIPEFSQKHSKVPDSKKHDLLDEPSFFALSCNVDNELKLPPKVSIESHQSHSDDIDTEDVDSVDVAKSRLEKRRNSGTHHRPMRRRRSSE